MWIKGAPLLNEREILDSQKALQNTKNPAKKTKKTTKKQANKPLKNLKTNIQVKTSPQIHEESAIGFLESDLHPLLVKFVAENEEFSLKCKTIQHQNGTRQVKGVDKWLYPDIVGARFEHAKYHDITRNLAEKFDKLPVKIYSFELKRELTLATFRESFFQAVSNSSWANYGYLVALDIDMENTSLLKLIIKSNMSFGIGVISIKSADISQSKIIAQAHLKENIDMNVVDDLCRRNDDFAKFLQAVVDFDPKHAGRYKDEFDKILGDGQLELHLQKMLLHVR